MEPNDVIDWNSPWARLIREAGIAPSEFTPAVARVAQVATGTAWNFPDEVSVMERRIIAKLLDAALEAGAWVAVDDEASRRSVTKNRSLIESWIGLTGQTMLHFHTPAEGRVGWVRLVHGNQEDVIVDFSASEWTERVVADANELAEWFREGAL